MKIYNLVENLDDSYGGPAKSIPFMCKYLSTEGIEPELLSIKYHENESNSVINDYGLDWKTFKYKFVQKLRYSVDLKNYLVKKLNHSNSIILHVHNLWNYIPFIAYILSNKYKVPLVISVRGSLYKWSLSQSVLQKKVAWFLFQKKMLQNAKCIHVTEEKEMEAVRALSITSPIAIIPNGIELNEFENMNTKDEAKSNLNLNINKKYILFMSRIHPKKGLEYLIKAWISDIDNYVEWDLLIVGPEYDKKYITKIKKILKENSLENRVFFTGMLTGEKRIDAFGASDLFMLPSHTENFGVVIAEAMAAKLPVITTHGTPWKEIEEQNAGWWVALNQKSINNTLSEALSHSSYELEKKGINAYNLIHKYEWKYQSDKMKELYEYILSGGKKPNFLYEFN